MTRRFHPLLFLALLAVAAGCVSTQKRYEKGVRLQAEARYAEAARYYVKVLEKEPDWEDARARLEAAGGRAIDGFLEEAERAEEEGRYEAAAEALDRLDGLRADAEAVRVPLLMPSGYDAYRAAVTDAALADVLRRAERAEREGDWADALEAYRRAQSRYALSEGEAADLDRRQADVLLRWSEEELERGRYRAAFDRAGEAVEIVGSEGRVGRAARRLQDAAVVTGTRHVAWLPVAVASSVADSVSGALLGDLDGRLQGAVADEASPFLAEADPFRLRRALRRTGFDGQPAPHVMRGPPTARDAATLGRDAGADLVVSVELAVFEREEEVESERTRSAPFEAGGRGPTSGRRTDRDSASRDTTYAEQHVDVALEAELAYRVVDVQTRRVVAEAGVRADVEGELRRGRFEGDWRRLDLSEEERELFEEETWRQGMAELETELVDRLVERLAGDLHESLLEQVD